MTGFTLEVGKKYKTRVGTIITITSAMDPATKAYELGYRFVGGPCGQYYTEDGKAYVNDPDDNPGDLILNVDADTIARIESIHRVLSNVHIGKVKPSSLFYQEMTPEMARTLLAAKAGYSISKNDVEQDCSVLARHAVDLIQSAFDYGRASAKDEMGGS